MRRNRQALTEHEERDTPTGSEPPSDAVSSKPTDGPLIRTRNLGKVYELGHIQVSALRDVDVVVQPAAFVAIVGPSGCGKTTLLNLVGALDTASSGSVSVLGHDVSSLGRRARADLRLRSLGFVFQAYNLVPVLTARENVEFVLELQGAGAERRQRAEEVLGALGLSDCADRRPDELSGGQQQRVAVARAVASRPKLILADEPTANLDGENAKLLLEMMRGLNEQHGITFVFSTHDPRVIAFAKRVITLRDGHVADDSGAT